MFAKYKADKYRYIKQYEKVQQNTIKNEQEFSEKLFEKGGAKNEPNKK